MKWIKYEYVCGTDTDGAEILAKKRVGYSESNLAIAEAEAYNGEYTIEDDGTEVSNETKVPGDMNMQGNRITNLGEPTDDKDAATLGKARELVTSAITDKVQLKPEFANSIEELKESGDTSKVYVLPDGYIYAYMAKTIPETTVPNFTNLAEPNDTNTTDWSIWCNNARVGSDGLYRSSDTQNVSNYIPAVQGDILRWEGFSCSANAIGLYKADKSLVASSTLNVHETNGHVTDASDISLTLFSGYCTIANSDVAYIRFTMVYPSGSTADDVIITKNEEIEYTTIPESYEYGWRNTGCAFVPTDYEDRILEIEEEVLNLRDEVESLVGSSTENIGVPSYWETMVTNKIETVKSLQVVGGKNCVCFAWAADTHIPDNSGGRTNNIGKVMAKMLDDCEVPFAIISGDVNTRASYAEESDLINAQASMLTHLYPLWGTDRLLVALGNHDGCYGDSSGYYKKQFTPEKMWQTFFRGQALDFRRVFSDDGMYYYIDNIAQKTRFIVLNSHFGGEYAEDDNGWAVNNRFSTSCYGQAQLDWLANVALDMPDGYSAIITAHVPPNVTYTVDKAQFIGIINAYCNKTTYSGSYAGVDGWTSNNISVDFANAKGEIIAMFAGHVHGDSIDTTTMSCPIITILSAGATANDPYAETAPTRTAGTDTETNFDMVVINKTTKTINCVRVGAGEDREFSY